MICRGGELTWRLLIPFVLQFVITLLTRDCSAHKTRKARNHIVYIMSRAHTVNTRCAYTLNLEYTHKQKEQKTERATSAAKSCSSWHSRSQLQCSVFYCTLDCLTFFFFYFSLPSVIRTFCSVIISVQRRPRYVKGEPGCQQLNQIVKRSAKVISGDTAARALRQLPTNDHLWQT